MAEENRGYTRYYKAKKKKTNKNKQNAKQN